MEFTPARYQIVGPVEGAVTVRQWKLYGETGDMQEAIDHVARLAKQGTPAAVIVKYGGN